MSVLLSYTSFQRVAIDLRKNQDNEPAALLAATKIGQEIVNLGAAFLSHEREELHRLIFPRDWPVVPPAEDRLYRGRGHYIRVARSRTRACGKI